MECLEQIEALNIKDVAEKTHISLLEIEAIIKKDFSRFNHTKAVGFTKIFKRDYNIDLTPWLEEYEEELGSSDKDNGIFIVSDEKDKVTFKTKLTYVLVGVFVLLSGILIFSTSFSGTTIESTDNKEMVEEAKRQVQENNSSSEEERTASMENLTTVTTGEALEEVEASEAAQEEIAQEEEIAEEIVDEVVQEEEAPKVAISSGQRLWISIRNNITNRTDSTIFTGEYPLDPNGNYTITFGHGYFDLINKDEVIESRESGIKKYRYENGKFYEEEYVPKPDPEPEPVETDEENNSAAVAPVEVEEVEEVQ